MAKVDRNSFLLISVPYSYGNGYKVSDFYLDESPTNGTATIRVDMSAMDGQNLRERLSDEYSDFEYLQFSYKSRVSSSLEISGVLDVSSVQIDDLGTLKFRVV